MRSSMTAVPPANIEWETVSSIHWNKIAHIDIANALNNLGIFYEEREDYIKGAEYQRMALEMYETIYKNDHLDLAMALNNLGTCYDSEQPQPYKKHKGLNYLIEAEAMYKRLFARNQEEYSPDKKNELIRDMAMAVYNLGAAYVDLDQLGEAQHYFKAALNYYETLNDTKEKLQIFIRLYECDKTNLSYKEGIMNMVASVLRED